MVFWEIAAVTLIEGVPAVCQIFLFIYCLLVNKAGASKDKREALCGINPSGITNAALSH